MEIELNKMDKFLMGMTILGFGALFQTTSYKEESEKGITQYTKFCTVFKQSESK